MINYAYPGYCIPMNDGWLMPHHDDASDLPRVGKPLPAEGLRAR